MRRPSIATWRLVAATLVAALACACSALAQSGAATAAAPTGQSFRIAGTVVNAVTGDPVQGAAVAVLDADGTRRIASSETAADGSFALDGLGAAKYALTASKRGYTTGFYMQHGKYSSAVVAGPGQETERMVLRLEPSAVIHGAVTADGGDAVEGATVLLFAKPKENEPGARIAQVGSVETDDTGAYEFAQIEAGIYYVVVQAKPWYAIHSASGAAGAEAASDTNSALDVAYPITFYDSTTDEASAAPIALTAGSRVEANINLHAVPALHLKFQAPVQADGSLAIPELRTGIFGVHGSEQGFERRVENNREGGTVEFDGVAPGRYELIQGDPQRMAQLDAESSESVDPSLGTFVVTIAGTLVNAAGSPLSGEALLTLAPADSTAGRSTLDSKSVGGSFNFYRITPGKWSLRVTRGDREIPIESTVIGSRKFAGNNFTVTGQDLATTATGPVLALKAVVEENPLRVEGFARKDGKGVAGAMVVLIPKDWALFPALARRDQSDSDGSFSLRDVAPGAYTIVAIENAWDDLDWSRPEVIGRYLPGGVAVKVASAPGGRVKLDAPVQVQPK